MENIFFDYNQPSTSAQAAAVRARNLVEQLVTVSTADGEWTEANKVVMITETEELLQPIQVNETTADVVEVGEYVQMVPVELLVQTFSNMGIEGLLVAEGVCKDWQSIIMDSQLWEKLVKDMLEQSRWKMLARQHCIPVDTHASGLKRQIEYRKKGLRLRHLMNLVEGRWDKGLRYYFTLYCGSPFRSVISVAMNEEHILTGQSDGSVVVWSRSIFEKLKEFSAHRRGVTSMVFGEKWLATCSVFNWVKLWDQSSFNALSIIRFHAEPITCLRSHGQTLATVSKRGSLVVWNLSKPSRPKQMFVVYHVDCVQACGIGKEAFVSGCDGGKLKVWSLPQGRLTHNLTGHDEAITCLRYRHPLVATGSADCTLRLWDIDRGCMLQILRGHCTSISSLDFNEKWIVSGTQKGIIKCWDMKAVQDPNSAAADLCKETYFEENCRIKDLACDDFLLVIASNRDINKCYYFDR